MIRSGAESGSSADEALRGWVFTGASGLSTTAAHLHAGPLGGGSYAFAANYGRVNSPTFGSTTYQGGWVEFYGVPYANGISGTATECFMDFYLSGTSQFYIAFRKDGKIELGRPGAGVLATSATALVPGAGYWFSLNVNIASVGGYFRLYHSLSSTAFVEYTGDTADTASDGFDSVSWFGYLNKITFDDCMIRTSAEGRITRYFHAVPMVPNSAGSSTDWTPSSGSNYACVDEIPHSTSDNVSATASAAEDLYNLTTTAWVPAEVMGIDIVGFGTVSGAHTGVQTSHRSGSTTTNSSTITLSSGSDSYFGVTYATNPATGSAYTAADLDNLQIGVKVP